MLFPPQNCMHMRAAEDHSPLPSIREEAKEDDTDDSAVSGEGGNHIKPLPVLRACSVPTDRRGRYSPPLRSECCVHFPCRQKGGNRRRRSML